MRVEFRLSMPNVGSWNGRWSGEGKRYTIKRNLTAKQVRELGLPTSWYYSFGDGWGASVSASVMESGERFKKSNGFCGYDWMVENILYYNRIEACPNQTDHNWRQAEAGWERCSKYGCSRSRKVEMASPGSPEEKLVAKQVEGSV